MQPTTAAHVYKRHSKDHRRAQEAQHRFAVAQAGHDEAEKVRRFNEGEAAMRHAEAVELQIRQALLDLVGGIVELTNQHCNACGARSTPHSS